MNNLSQLATYYYNYSTINTTSTLTPAQATGIILVVLLIEIFVIAIAYVVSAILVSMIFKKAGIPKWIAWVPFYNIWKLLELGGQPGFWAVLFIVPVVNIAAAIFMYIAMFHIGKKFGKSDAFVLLGIFLPIVWYAILAFDSSKWHGQKIATPTAAA